MEKYCQIVSIPFVSIYFLVVYICLSTQTLRPSWEEPAPQISFPFSHNFVKSRIFFFNPPSAGLAPRPMERG